MSKPPLTVMIDGEVVLVEMGSFNAELAIEERSTCSFRVIDMAGAKDYRKGQPVIAMGEEGSRIFGGVIEEASRELIQGGGCIHDITCVDWHYLADKRIAAASYVNTAADGIVLDLVEKYLADEGVSITDVILEDLGDLVLEAY